MAHVYVEMPVAFFDTVDAGGYRCSGIVHRLSIPGPYKVRLHAKDTGRAVRTTLSDETGVYLFEKIGNPVSGYFVAAFDHGAEPVNAAISDQLTMESMP